MRPRDFRDVYAEPGGEFARLARDRVLLRLAHGHYALVPEARRLDYWRPAIEGVALGIAVADYGRQDVALMGVTAARVLGAIPRALATAVVAIPQKRTPLVTVVGTVTFVTRAVPRLDLQRADTEVTAGWVTTPEQTVLDLADRPLLGDAGPATVTEAIRALGPSCDLDLVAGLAAAQRKRVAWRRLAWVLGIPAPPADAPAPTYGLQGPGDPAGHGLIVT